MKHFTIVLPLFIEIPRKTKPPRRVSLNMNTYRNLHHVVSNQAKVIFKEIVREKIGDCPKFHQPVVSYHLVKKGKRRTDLMNWVTVIDKFLMDALVEFGIIKDDNTDYISNYSADFLGCADIGKMIVEIHEE